MVVVLHGVVTEENAIAGEVGGGVMAAAGVVGVRFLVVFVVAAVVVVVVLADFSRDDTDTGVSCTILQLDK